jgi:O-antigen biosynthesis protein
MQVALLGGNAPIGDALGNLMAEKALFFRERGADVRVFLESDQRLHPSLAPHYQVVESDLPEGEHWKFLRNADLIIVDFSQSHKLLGCLPLLAKGKARIIFDYHSITPLRLWDSHNREGIEKGGRLRGLVWCADSAWVHSQFARQELSSATDFPETWVRRMGYPVDLEHFSLGEPSLDWRQRLGLGPVHLLLFVGRLAPNKRVPVLVEALARLKDRTPAVHALVAGDQSDVYGIEANRCRDLANALGISNRLHLIGRLHDEELLDAYRSADMLVMPSVHEGFCIPIVEAMACGVPVIAARAAALPETVASAGLTFVPNEADDLARQIRRVLIANRGSRIKDRKLKIEDRQLRAENHKNAGQEFSILNPPSSILNRRPFRVAVVAFRFGADFVGGAESSLRTAALALRDQGHHVEVLTTCTRSEGNWVNELPEGTSQSDGIPIHRFRIDSHDRERHLESVRAIFQSENGVNPEVEVEYLKHSIHSTRLIEELRRREAEFDAVIAGPYLHGLTYDVARAVPEKTIVVPCFHDEPFAGLRVWPITYGRVGGIWYHSKEEQEFAEVRLGLNHPGALCVGTWLDLEKLGDRQRGLELVGTEKPYVVYCGRYSPQKGLPTLLNFARRYQEANPGRFTFAFLGEGDIQVPRTNWARDLGFVSEPAKRDIVAGASALIQLSRHESLSLVALEAWAQGTPVIADSRCAVLAGHLGRCAGGQAVDSYESFAAALDDLWRNPEAWQARGRQGQRYVRETYGDREAYARALEDSIRDLSLPLADRMRRRGRERAALHSRSVWKERLAELIDEIMDCPRRAMQDNVEVTPRTETMTVARGQETILVPVRLINRGTHPIAHEGPGRSLLLSRVTGEEEAGKRTDATATTSLPDLLMPGQTLPAAVLIRAPTRPGSYQVTFKLVPGWHQEGAWEEENAAPVGAMRLVVENRFAETKGSCLQPMLDEIRAMLAEAARCQRLPDDYTDVTQGWLAKWKRWVKRKLLGNFKRAYVDVLSRQQSRFNQQILTAVTELADYCATLEHAAKAGDQRSEVRGQRPEIRGQKFVDSASVSDL